MVQWFFLDGINVAGNKLSKYQCVQYTGTIFADTANTPLAIPDGASVMTQVADDLSIVPFTI
jgi:hypothetical protein